LKSVATYLNQYQLVLLDLLNEAFVDLFGHRLSQSTLIEGKRRWCHVVSTENLTYYAAYSNRGSKANEDMGILPIYSGTAMHDSWSSYFKFKCKHALCNAHHIRDLLFVHEEDKQNWARDLIDLLIGIKTTVDRRKPIDCKLDLAEINDFEERYDHIIERSKLGNPPPIASNSQGLIKKTWKKEKVEVPKSVGEVGQVSKRGFGLHA